LLLPCLLLTQAGAALSHTHGGDDPAEHELRPHVHVHMPWDDSHSHHHEHDVPGLPADHDHSPSDHDSDAVYVKSVDVLVRPHTIFADVLTASIAWNSLEWPGVSMSLDHGLQTAYPALRPPPGGYDCPLYLLQLALLI
jgi:hypothetical protein